MPLHDPKEELIEELRAEVHSLRAELFPHKMVALTRQLLLNPAFQRSELGQRVTAFVDSYDDETKLICREI